MDSEEKNKPEWGSTFIRTRVSKEEYIDDRSWRDFNALEWTYIIASLACLLTGVGFSIYQIVLGQYLFPAVVIISAIFGVYFLYTGILKESQFQVLMQMLTKLVGWIFDLIYFLNVDEDTDSAEADVKRIRFYVNSALLAINIPIGGVIVWKYWTSNVVLFRTVGTEPRYVDMYRILLLGYSLLAFDSQISIVAVILIAVPVTAESGVLSSWHQITILSAGVPVIGLWVFLGCFVMSRERKYWTFVFYFYSHIHILYVVYLVAKTPRRIELSQGRQDYNFLLLRNTIYFIAALFFVTHATLMAVVVKIQLNYGKGLRQAVKHKGMLKNQEETEVLKSGSRPPAFETEL